MEGPKAACLAGLGSMGRSGLFLHRRWGPRVRLATLFTDWPELAATVSEMTEPTKAKRDGIPYPEAYRAICAEGARLRRIKNAFKVARDQ